MGYIDIGSAQRGVCVVLLHTASLQHRQPGWAVRSKGVASEGGIRHSHRLHHLVGTYLREAQSDPHENGNRERRDLLGIDANSGSWG